MFKTNKSLVHVDLSHNGFSREACEIMTEGLEHNHSILGLHMLGNACNTDALGFIKADNSHPGASHIITRISSDLETG